jgi:hypothetical protein
VSAIHDMDKDLSSLDIALSKDHMS